MRSILADWLLQVQVGHSARFTVQEMNNLKLLLGMIIFNFVNFASLIL